MKAQRWIWGWGGGAEGEVSADRLGSIYAYMVQLHSAKTRRCMEWPPGGASATSSVPGGPSFGAEDAGLPLEAMGGPVLFLGELSALMEGEKGCLFSANLLSITEYPPVDFYFLSPTLAGQAPILAILG